MNDKISKNAFNILRSSITTLMNNKIILYPFFLIICVQFLILEILYFAPQFPLNKFFGPLISKLWSESFLHYPNYFLLLPKLFQYSQFFIYIFLNGFLIGIAILAIKTINDGKKVTYNKILTASLSSYLHILILSFITFFLIMLFIKGYGNLIDRAEQIRSTNGHFYWIKRIVIDGAAYINLIISVFVSTVFAYTLPIIMIEKKKIFSSILLNFQSLRGTFCVTFLVILLPSLFFIPILLLRSSIPSIPAIPEIRLVILSLSIVTTVLIDAIIYTALTSVYLLQKETA